jgi:hypothetical protein
LGQSWTYVKVQHEDGWTYYLAEGRSKTASSASNEVVARLKGEDLVGWNYRGPFDELPAAQKAFLPRPIHPSRHPLERGRRGGRHRHRPHRARLRRRGLPAE